MAVLFVFCFFLIKIALICRPPPPLILMKLSLKKGNTVWQSFQTLTHTLTHLYPCNFEHFIPGQKSSVNAIITEAHSGTEMHHKDLLNIQGSDL